MTKYLAWSWTLAEQLGGGLETTWSWSDQGVAVTTVMEAFLISESSFLGLVCDKVAMGQFVVTLCFKEGQRKENFLNPMPGGGGGTTP